MKRKFQIELFFGGYWNRILILSVMLFFIYLGDGILSDWVPTFMQDSTGSSLVMGLIMSFSSLVGFGADLVFPQLLKLVKTRKLMLMAIGTSLVFSGILLWTTVLPWIVLFLIAMAVWGIYYEFLGFGSYQFVSESVPTNARAGAWAVMGVFKSLAYFLGPIIGSYFAMRKGNAETVLVAVFFVFLGYLLWLATGRHLKQVSSESSHERINLWREVGQWRILLEHVWPVLILSIGMGLIDATFWTTGTVLSDNLAEQSWMGGMFLPFYMLPMVIFGVVVARWGIYKGKKKIAEISMLIAGICLSLMGVVDSVVFMLGVSLLTGTALAVAWPMTDAVYSDIVQRMGREGKHMVGLSSSTISLAYIIGPILAGGIAQFIGERMTFSFIGILMVFVSIFLLVVTPKKLRLPQKEIRNWD